MKNFIILMLSYASFFQINLGAQTLDPQVTPTGVNANPMAPKWSSSDGMTGLPVLPGMGAIPVMPNLDGKAGHKTATSQAASSESSLPKLQGVLISANGQALAMIDGKTMEVGRQIKGWTVEKIENNSVQLTRPGESLRLRVFSGASEISNSTSEKSIKEPQKRVKKQYKADPKSAEKNDQ